MKICKFEEPFGVCMLFDKRCNSIDCSLKNKVGMISSISTIDNKEVKVSDNEKMSDNVNHPAHYTQGGIECIDAIEAAVTGLSGIDAVCTGNAIKYLWRWKQKNGIEDLKKARWYINRLIEREKRNDGKRA